MNFIGLFTGAYREYQQSGLIRIIVTVSQTHCKHCLEKRFLRKPYRCCGMIHVDQTHKNLTH